MARPKEDKEYLRKAGNSIASIIYGKYREWTYRNGELDIQAQSLPLPSKRAAKNQMIEVSDFLDRNFSRRDVAGYFQISVLVTYRDGQGRESADARRLGKNWYKTVYHEWKYRVSATTSGMKILENIKKPATISLQFNLNWNPKHERPTR